MIAIPAADNCGPLQLGLLLHAVVHPADIQDRDGGVRLWCKLSESTKRNALEH
jgi:hypothetical protein